MSVYLLHDRNLRLYKGNEISSYPAKVKIIVKFSPGDAFGVEDNNPRTVFKKDEKHHYAVDERDGTVEITEAMLDPIASTLQIDSYDFILNGNELSIIGQFSSKEDLLRYITSANQFLPALISFRFQNYVWISDFKVVHGEGLYYFFVSRIRPPVTVTTEEIAIGHFNDSINQWLQTKEGEERIVVALYYYRQALRLSKLEPAPQTMIPETLLNLAKSLEIIFSCNRDRFRKMAKEIGLNDDFVETKLIPVLCLRNDLGIAHVSTAPLQLSDKDLIQQFMVKAFNNVQFTINHVVEKVRSGEFQLGRISTKLDNAEIKLIESVKTYLVPVRIGANLLFFGRL